MRATKGGTGFPAGINAASTFSRRLMRARGVAVGEEFRGKGVRFVRVPVDPLNLNMVNLYVGCFSGPQWILYDLSLPLVAELPHLTSALPPDSR